VGRVFETQCSQFPFNGKGVDRYGTGDTSPNIWTAETLPDYQECAPLFEESSQVTLSLFHYSGNRTSSVTSCNEQTFNHILTNVMVKIRNIFQLILAVDSKTFYFTQKHILL